MGTVLAAAGVSSCLGGSSEEPTAATATEEASQLDGVIVYWSESPWPSIWMIRADGSKPQRILRNRQNAKRPRLSPDGRWVAFDGAPPGEQVIGDFDIQLVRSDGTGLRTLTNSAQWDVDAQWSPDGRSLSFTRMPPGAEWLEATVWTMRRDGTGLRGIARGQLGRWSPDGSQLVLDAPTDESDGDLFVVGANGGKPRLLLASPELDQPAGWSPDGKRILFTRFNDASGRNTDVYIVNADGTGARRLGPGLAGGWSPDGTKIVYAESDPGRILVMDADGSNKRAIAGAFGAEPDWQ